MQFSSMLLLIKCVSVLLFKELRDKREVQKEDEVKVKEHNEM